MMIPDGSVGDADTQGPADEKGTPKPKAQRNFTDGDSRIMKTGDGFIQGYNAQIAVDAEHQVIVAQALTNQPPAEPPFGQIKNRGFRQLLLRGLTKARAEWALISTSHNLLKLHRATYT